MADLILEIVEGKDAGRQLDLDRPLDVGRDQGMPIALPDDTQVSRRHARVSPQIGLTVMEVRSPQQVQQRASAVQPRPQFTQVGEGVLAPVPDQQLGGPAPASGGFVPAAGAAAPSAAAPQQEAPTENPPPPTPPLPGARGAAPVFRPGVGFRAAETPAGYVPPEVVGDDEAESDYGALARLVGVRVKQQRNIAAFAILAASGLAVLLYFGLT